MKNCSIRFSFTSYKRTTAILSCCGSKKSSERLQIVASFYSSSYLFASNLCTFYLSNISLFFSIVFFGRVSSYVFRKRFFFLFLWENFFLQAFLFAQECFSAFFSDVCRHNRCTDFSLREDNDHTHVSILCASGSWMRAISSILKFVLSHWHLHWDFSHSQFCKHLKSNEISMLHLCNTNRYFTCDSACILSSLYLFVYIPSDLNKRQRKSKIFTPQENENTK